MPAYTSPDNIQYPVSTDSVAPLETVFANMANSTQDAFDGFRIDWNNFEASRAIQTFQWADATERGAQTGMVAGDIGYQADTSTYYKYTGSAWVVANFEDTGWLTFSLGSGWTGQANNVPQYRRINGIVYLRGRVAHSSGTTGVICTLPAGFRPSTSGGETQIGLFLADATTAVRVGLHTNGDVQIYTNPGTNLVSLINISFPADS